MTVNIVVNGLPGNMASQVAQAAVEAEDISVIPLSLTGPEIELKTHIVSGVEFTLFRPEERDQFINKLSEKTGFVCVDFTHPDAAYENVEFYCSHELPFVMGTTGGRRDEMKAAVKKSPIPAVIAPNMAKQIVGLQMMLEYAAENFPGLFQGYSMQLQESHQSGKADTSGTAKAMVSYFNKMGINFDVENIQKTREPSVQKSEWGVPNEYLSGHAYHTYELLSSDKTVDFKFEHNVRGRKIYALGTLDAVRFLSKKIKSGSTDLYTMIDILKAGNMA